VFFGNPINENQRGEAIPKRGKIAILTPKNAFSKNDETIEKSRLTPGRKPVKNVVCSPKSPRQNCKMVTNKVIPKLNT